MAQATLESAADEAAAAPAAGGLSADDLLSKMAGAEIDRLLNEAESDHAPAAPAAPQPLAQASTTAAEDNALASQLDELIGSMDTEKPAAAQEVPVAAAPSSAEPAAPAPALPAEAAEAERMKVLASELEVDKPTAAAAPATAEAPAIEPVPQPAAEKIAIWMYPLILINAPFFFLPERIREFMGKAALITMANAAAVMIYVTVFRHR